MTYHFVDHTADVAADLTGGTLDELFASAAAALTDTITDASNVHAKEDLPLTVSSIRHVGKEDNALEAHKAGIITERERQLAQIVGDCVARAGAAGFTVEDLLEQLRDLVPEAIRRR